MDIEVQAKNNSIDHRARSEHKAFEWVADYLARCAHKGQQKASEGIVFIILPFWNHKLQCGIVEWPPWFGENHHRQDDGQSFRIQYHLV